MVGCSVLLLFTGYMGCNLSFDEDCTGSHPCNISPWWLVVVVYCYSGCFTCFLDILHCTLSVGHNPVQFGVQIIHFEKYGKLLEMDMDVSFYIEEHMRLTHLSKISHRFCIILLLEFLVVSASQFVALLLTTGKNGIINFLNAGNFAVCHFLFVA